MQWPINVLENVSPSILLPSLVVSGAALVYYFKSGTHSIVKDPNCGIFITGCDTGLGFSMAVHSATELGCTVFAGCLDVSGEGATKLKEYENIHVVELDVRKDESIKSAFDEVCRKIDELKTCRLKALVNNAGVMIFGEFHWLTTEMIEASVVVNLLGSMKVTAQFAQVLEGTKGRIVNIGSHCAFQSLPGLSIYGASKAGIHSWSDALRFEMKPYGVDVVVLVPGSFVTQTSIIARQSEHINEMEKFMEKRGRSYQYFQTYKHYLSYIPTNKRASKVVDDVFYKKFTNALLAPNPKKMYVNEPWRYTIYHALFKIPLLTDWFVRRFMVAPKNHGN